MGGEEEEEEGKESGAHGRGGCRCVLGNRGSGYVNEGYLGNGLEVITVALFVRMPLKHARSSGVP